MTASKLHVFRGQSTLPESSLRQLKRSFYTDVSASYMENMVKDVVPKLGVDFVKDKELYLVKVCFHESYMSSSE